MRTRATLLALGAFFAISSVYFVFSAGIVSTNDGSHFALVRAITETGRLEINPYIRYTADLSKGPNPDKSAYIDLSYRDGQYYSDRPPGTAFLAVPLNLATRLVERLGLGSSANLPEMLAPALPAFAGALSVLLVFAIARRLGVRKWSARAAALVWGFGTLEWKYAAVLYSHSVSAAVVLAGIWLLLIGIGASADQREQHRHSAALVAAGLLLGFSVAVEYTNVIIAAICLGYLVAKRRDVKETVLLCASGIAGVVPLAVYDTLAFGRPWATSYTYQYHFEWARSISTTYIHWPWEGVVWLLTSPGSLLAITPALLLSIAGIVILFRQHRLEATLLAAPVVVLLVLTGMHRTYTGGGTQDARYLLTIVPLAVLPMATCLDSILRTRRLWIRRALLALAAVLIAASGVRAFLAVYSMFGKFAAEHTTSQVAQMILDGKAPLSALAPGLSSYPAFAGLALLVTSLVLVVSLARSPVQVLSQNRKAGWLPAGALGVAIVVAGGGISWHNSIGNWQAATAEAQALLAPSNLMPNPSFEVQSAEPGTPDGWTLKSARVTEGGQDGHSSLEITGAEGAVSPHVQVQGGHEYDISLYSRGGGQLNAQVQWLNQDSNAIDANARHLVSAGTDWAHRAFQLAAPIDAVALQLTLQTGSDPVKVDSVRVSDTGVRMEPMEGFAKAALAFTFDWETAMGGYIHSRGATDHDPTSAGARGEMARAGTEKLLELFDRYGIKGTFYATGYNLLDGNQQGATFSGDPTYAWAKTSSGWASPYWTTHPWFSDDPHGTYLTDPGWYFGDLTTRMAQDGQDIQTHTFGHLYVRGATPEQIKEDLAQWDQAAQGKGLAPATSLAFPWRSSNSLTAPFYQAIEKSGIQVLTRLFTYRFPYSLDVIPGFPDLVVYPDAQVVVDQAGESGDSTPGTASAGKLAEATTAATADIDQAILLHGYTSLWTHPDEVDSPGTYKVWQEIVAYAAQKRDQGDLWIDTITNIVGHRKDLDKVGMHVDQNGRRFSVTLNNTNDHAVQNLTLTFPSPIQKVEGIQADNVEARGEQLVIRNLPKNMAARLDVTLDCP